MNKIIIVIMVTLLNGCANFKDRTKDDLMVEKIKGNVDEVYTRFNDEKESFLDIKIAKKPKDDAFLDNDNTLNTIQLSYRNLQAILPIEFKKRVLVSHNLKDPNEVVKLEYSGNNRGFLDAVCYELKCSWRYQNGVVYFTKFETRNWRLPILPTDRNATTDVSGGIAVGGSSSTSSGGESGVDGLEGGNNVTSSGGQSVSSKFTYDHNKTVSSLIEPYLDMSSETKETYHYSPQTGLLVVSASNITLDLIDNVIKEYSYKLTSMVNFDVDIIIYSEQDNNQHGFSWDVIWNNLNDLGINFSNSSNVDSTGDSIGFNIINDGSPFGGSSGLLQALSEHVDIVSKKELSFRTLSNQVLPFSVADEIPYQLVTSTLVPNVGITTTVSIIKESVGLHINLLPVILEDDNLLVEFKASFTSTNNVLEIDLGDNGSARVPQVSKTETMQQIKMINGESMVLTGFNLSDSNVSKRSPFSSNLWFTGGSKNRNTTKKSMVIVITPRVVH